jgi:hypothetical protein
MEHTACNIIASTSSKIQHATPTSTSTYALFAAAGPEFAQPPKLKHGGCVRSFSVLLFVEDTFPQWLHALSE